MAKKSEQDKRLSGLAKSSGLSSRDYLEALLDMATGQITPKQFKDSAFLMERYFTPSTYKLFAERNRLVLDGMSKKNALKELKVKYPRASKAQWDAVAKL